MVKSGVTPMVVSNTTTFSATAISILTSILEWNWFAISMAGVAIISAIWNVKITKKKDRREAEEHKIRMGYLKLGIDPDKLEMGTGKK